MFEKIKAAEYDSPIGKIILAAEGESLCGVWFLGQKYFDMEILNRIAKNNETEILKQGKDWLRKYFEGKKPDIKELSLAPSGSCFRKEVWKILCKIPYGKTMTYKEIAKIIADKKGLDKMSAQAVGGAIGHNPISIIIPCHRVLGQNGKLTGYAGGLDKKLWLLNHEGCKLEDV